MASAIQHARDRPSSCSHPGGRAAPGSSGCCIPLPADSSQTNDAGSGTSPASRVRPPARHPSPPAAIPIRGDDAAAAHHSPDRCNGGWRETPIANPTRAPRSDASPAAVRQRHGSAPARNVTFVLRFHPLEMIVQRLSESTRQHRHAILPALAVSHHHLAAIEVDVFDAKLRAFKQPESAPDISEAISHTGPRRRSSSDATSDRDSTTGNRDGRCARTIVVIHGMRRPRTTSCRNKTALSA